jgi:Tfp pilus assembly protein PilF
LKRDAEAYDAFYRAVHSEDYLSRAYERLATISLRRGNVSDATAEARLAIDKNALNPQLWALLATAERLSGRTEAALEAAEHSLQLDPLNAWGANEKAKALAALGRPDRETRTLVRHLLHDTQTALEFSWYYANSGQFEDALELLAGAEENSLVLYHRAYLPTAPANRRRGSDLLVSAGEYAEALSYLQANHFNSWEGGYSIHNVYMEANVGLAENEADPRKALEHYRRACEYPDNLEVAPREPNLRGFLYYPMAKLYRSLGEEDEARRLLEIVAAEVSGYPTLGTYYQALALRDLGREGESNVLITELKAEANLLIEGESQHYLRTSKRRQEALGHLYLSKVLEAEGKEVEAADHLRSAREVLRDIERQAVMIAQRVYAQAHQ